MQNYVPVVSSTNKPLMPTTNQKANKLIAKGRALRRFNKGIFYIKLVDREDGYTQPVAMGIDPGSKKEGFTIKSESHTYISIQADAVTWVSRNIKDRRDLRRSRRLRKTPYRKCRYNRNINKQRLSPSTKSRWQLKLRIVNLFCKLYPITHYCVEDIAAISQKGRKIWNKSFGPLQQGKNWFYKELSKIGVLTTLKGYETKKERDKYGLIKIKQKLSDDFHAHCVDSWVLANYVVGGHSLPENKNMIYISPIMMYRRRLHALQPKKGGVRKRYGGTKSLYFKKGSFVKHSKYGIVYVGGYSDNRISIHSIESGRRLRSNIKPQDCSFICYSNFRIRQSGDSKTK